MNVVFMYTFSYSCVHVSYKYAAEIFARIAREFAKELQYVYR